MIGVPCASHPQLVAGTHRAEHMKLQWRKQTLAAGTAPLQCSTAATIKETESCCRQGARVVQHHSSSDLPSPHRLHSCRHLLYSASTRTPHPRYIDTAYNSTQDDPPQLDRPAPTCCTLPASKHHTHQTTAHRQSTSAKPLRPHLPINK
jgi:hypothetical protein